MVSDGVVSLSPFRSVIASKERVNRLITNIFELENDRLRQQEIAKAKKAKNASRSPRKQTTSSLRKVSSMKQLALGKKVPSGSLLKTKTAPASVTQHFQSKVQQALQNASLKRVDGYLAEVL